MAYSSIEVYFSKVILGCIKLTTKTYQDSHEVSLSLLWMGWQGNSSDGVKARSVVPVFSRMFDSTSLSEFSR